MARDIDSMMRIIAALLAKAEASKFPEEAKSFRAKAESLMREYRIEEEALIAEDPFAITPSFSLIQMTSALSEFRADYAMLLEYAAMHTGVLYKFEYRASDQSWCAGLVGYAGDIRMTEFLFNAAKLMMMSKLEPEVDSELSDAENIYRLRSAGIERNRIAQMLWGEWNHSNSAKVGMVYREECDKRGENATVTGRTVNAKTYRAVYAREFRQRFAQRLRIARDAANSIGGAAVLYGRAERVQEAFWTRYPSERPAPKEEAPATKPKKPKAAKQLKPSKALEAKYQRLYNGPAARAATEAGRTAANGVQIERVAPAQRVEETRVSGIELEG